MFDIEKLTCYADDGFGIEHDKIKDVVANKIKIKLEKICDWLGKSGMKVNESKTSLCLFCSRDTARIEVVFNGATIRSVVLRQLS